MINGGFINLTYKYDLTWHYDKQTDEAVITNAAINIVRGDPQKVSTAPGTGFWDTVTFAIPTAPLPHEDGIAIGDLPGVSGESLWNNFGNQNYGILGFFSQNNKTEQYTIKYGSVTPYRVKRNADGTFTLLVGEDRYNDYGSDGQVNPDGSLVHPNPDGIHIHPAWIHNDIKVNVTVPTVPVSKIHYHYNTSAIDLHFPNNIDDLSIILSFT